MSAIKIVELNLHKKLTVTFSRFKIILNTRYFYSREKYLFRSNLVFCIQISQVEDILCQYIIRILIKSPNI
jgi:hypothetical protein